MIFDHETVANSLRGANSCVNLSAAVEGLLRAVSSGRGWHAWID